MKKKYVLILCSIWVTGCLFLNAAGSRDSVGESPEKAARPIRIGVMPDAGALPLYLMPEVETVPFMSARERDTALQTGELDAVTGDLVGLLHFRVNGIKNRVLTLTESRFLIVADSGAQRDSEGEESLIWKVGISENTVIEFMVDQMVPEAVRLRGLEKTAVPRVPVRLEMLRSGKLPMACLTDVMAQSLPPGRFRVVRDQRDTDLEPAVLVFSETFLETRAEEITSFKRSWNRAVEAINADPDKYRPLLAESVRLPADTSYDVPFFRPVTLPGRTTVNRVLEWYKNKYGTEELPSYEDLIIR